MPSEKKIARRKCYVASVKKRMHASVTHNIALTEAVLAHEQMLAAIQPHVKDKKAKAMLDAYVAALEPDWHARFRVTLEEAMAIPDDQIDLVIQTAKERHEAERQARVAG